MHQFPSDPALRAKWVKFVQRHRTDIREPSKYASLCSVHFEDSCYNRPLAPLLQGMSAMKLNRMLIKGSIPTRDTNISIATPEISERQKRQVYFFIYTICVQLSIVHVLCS